MADLLIDPHPFLAQGVLVCTLPGVGTMPSPDWLTDLLKPDAPAPLQRAEVLRSAVRELLRHGGYKPTGRGKPSSEYLARAAAEGQLASVHPLVDVCNAVSLHSGIPISVVDLDKAREPLRIALAPAGASYVFNASGQTIDLEGLLCLFDALGPCANAVKDSQRTKLGAGTLRCLSVLWGVRGHEERTVRAAAWYTELLQRLGATVSPWTGGEIRICTP